MEIILWGIFIITTMIFAKFVLMNKNSHKFSDLELLLKRYHLDKYQTEDKSIIKFV